MEGFLTLSSAAIGTWRGTECLASLSPVGGGIKSREGTQPPGDKSSQGPLYGSTCSLNSNQQLPPLQNRGCFN